MKNSKWSEFYSKVFDSVQIDSLFYNIPIIFTVKKWLKKKQDNFRFTANFQKVITHDKRLKNIGNKLELFFKGIKPLMRKL